MNDHAEIYSSINNKTYETFYSKHLQERQRSVFVPVVILCDGNGVICPGPYGGHEAEGRNHSEDIREAFL